MNVYLLTIAGDRQPYLDALNANPMVRNWFAFLPTAIAVVSLSDLASFSHYLQQLFPNDLFIVVSVPHGQSGGLLPPEVWDFINNPRDSGMHPPIPSLTHPSLMSGLPRSDSQPAQAPNPLVQPGWLTK